MGDKTFCHEARSSRAIRVDGEEGFIWTVACSVSSMLVADGMFLSPVHENRVTHIVAVEKT